MVVKDGVDGDNQDVKTSETQPQTSKVTYTEDQVLERERKARSDVLADMGRLKAESQKAMKTAQEAQERLDRMMKERSEAELEAHKDEPDVLKAIRAEQRARELESELEAERKTRTEHEERLKVIETERAEQTRTQSARDIAARIGVDPERLLKLSKYTDGTTAAIEDIAKELPRTTDPKNKFKPDSNRTLGGNLTWEQVRAAYIQDPYNPSVKARYLEMKAQQ